MNLYACPQELTSVIAITGGKHLFDVRFAGQRVSPRAGKETPTQFVSGAVALV
jgi:hypothetical protein